MLCLRKKINVKKMLFKVKRNRKTKRKKEKKRIKIHPLCGPGEESNYDHEMKLATFLYR